MEYLTLFLITGVDINFVVLVFCFNEIFSHSFKNNWQIATLIVPHHVTSQSKVKWGCKKILIFRLNCNLLLLCLGLLLIRSLNCENL